MFNIEKSHCVRVEQQLLYNIQELLKELIPEKEDVIIKNEPPNEFNGIECRYCGGIHSNRGEFLACSRKNKKEREQK